MSKRIISMMVAMAFFLSVSVFAKDNADSGSDGSQKAVAGYYRSRDWMYKVSVYVGKSNQAELSMLLDFHLVGQPIFLAPTSLNVPTNFNIYCSPYNKMQYFHNNLSLSLLEKDDIARHEDVPAIPIINKGSITAVKRYFGDTNTLINILDNIAKAQGTTKEALLTANTYIIGGNPVKLTAAELLPVKNEAGVYQNKVPYVIVYEPIAIGYLVDGKTALAFTATEYAIAQRKGFMNFFNRALGGDNPQLMWGLTHRDLPNSIFLEESWLGIPARKEIKNRKRTSEWTKEIIDSVSDTIIAAGGIGMRYLNTGSVGGGNKRNAGETVYRINTEVITAVDVSAPATSNRIDKFNPNNPGYVTFMMSGQTKRDMVVLPDGGTQTAWVKWTTPPAPGRVTIRMEASGGLLLPGGSSVREMTVVVVDPTEETPPDPKPRDLAKDFDYKEVPLPNETEYKEATWSEYFATWHEHWVDNGEWVDQYTKDPVTGQWVLSGQTWESNWEDEGWWDWEKRTYEAKLSANMKLFPSGETPTAKKITGFSDHYEMKSGYGVETEVQTTITTNAPSIDHYTTAGNVVVYFPEFKYDTYWRLLAKKNGGKFTFAKNPFSQWEAPVHFTPIWFPDKRYTAFGMVLDVWTPGGMLQANVSDYVEIKGNVYDDWHIGPTKYGD